MGLKRQVYGIIDTDMTGAARVDDLSAPTVPTG